MISFEDIRPQLKKFVQEGCETADYIMRVSKTPKDGIYAYEEVGEIVRCRYCRHYHAEINGCDEFGDIWHDEYANVEPDGFCAWGELRGDAE